MHVEYFYHQPTATFTFVVACESTGECAIIDPVLDYEMESGRVSTTAADQVIEYVKKKKLTVTWLLETHIHADHLTASSYLKEKLGGKTGIGKNITEVLKFWVPLFNTEEDTPLDGSQFDHLFEDGETFSIGSLQVSVIFTPGHTPACACYHIGNALFVGDTIFMPHMGTARADFPGGSAKTLYASIQKILALPGDTRIFVAHDYPPTGEQPKCESSVTKQKRENIMVSETITESEYITRRTERDAKLAVPRLLLPSIQVNLRGGKLGEAAANGKQYLKIPINAL